MSTIKNLFSSFLFLLVTSSLIGCSSGSKQDGTTALFNTREEAEKAAKTFNCTGAHKMGDKWMPCKTHKVNENDHKKSGQGNHHHHNH